MYFLLSLVLTQRQEDNNVYGNGYASAQLADIALKITERIKLTILH
jgi:hypothetical protein